jgi:hypothetical protein
MGIQKLNLCVDCMSEIKDGGVCRCPCYIGYENSVKERNIRLGVDK